jgi:hypothetical protein
MRLICNQESVTVMFASGFRHNYSDVLTGALIGLASVFVSIRLYGLDFVVPSHVAVSPPRTHPLLSDADGFA